MAKDLKQAVVIEIFIHLLFWTAITLLPILSQPFINALHRPLFSYWHFVLVNSLLAVQFYLNAFLLIPIVLNRQKRIALFFFLLTLSFIAIYNILTHSRPEMPFQHLRMVDGQQLRAPLFDGFSLFPLLAITAAGFAYRYLADQFRVINNKRDITNQALVSELAFLRSQISPHFIFNVINSVVALSRLNPVLVEPTLIQLSRLLRYMLYISDEEKVTLSQKTNYLGSYVELQKLRFQDMVAVTLNFNIAAPEKTIEPMLLIPFVENAFKHGTGGGAIAAIVIDLKSDHKTLDFKVSNNYNPNKTYMDEAHGIGLANVKRRLELLYPAKHNLTITENNNIYNVNLKIQLK